MSDDERKDDLSIETDNELTVERSLWENSTVSGLWLGRSAVKLKDDLEYQTRLDLYRAWIEWNVLEEQQGEWCVEYLGVSPEELMDIRIYLKTWEIVRQHIEFLNFNFPPGK